MLLEWARKRQPEVVDFIRQLVECESPSDSPPHLRRFNELFADSTQAEASCQTKQTHLVCKFRLPGPRTKQSQILALGHSDTVWPLGTLQTMPFRRAEGRLWGPGVLDMKAGLAMMVFAMQALRELDIPVRRHVLLQINSDEETGSKTSRALTERQRKTEPIGAGARTGHRAHRQNEDRAQGDRRLRAHRARGGGPRRCRFRKGRKRRRRTGEADRTHRRLHRSRRAASR